MARFIAGRKSILPQLVHRGIYGFFQQLALWKLCRTTRGSGQMYGFVLSSLRRGETGWRTCGKRSCFQRMHLACSICRLHVSPADGTTMQSMRSSTTSAAPSSLKSRHQMHRKIPSEISDSTVRALRGFCVSRNGDQISIIPFSSFGIGSAIRRST